MNLTTLHTCNPDYCPIADSCKQGPLPNLPCPLKQQYSKTIEENIACTFKDLSTQPEVSFRVNLLLKPLFDQLLMLRIEQLRLDSAFVGIRINPILKEFRQTIMAIDQLITSISSTAREINKQEALSGFNELRGGAYYDMVLLDNKFSVQDPVGPVTEQ